MMRLPSERVDGPCLPEPVKSVKASGGAKADLAMRIDIRSAQHDAGISVGRTASPDPSHTSHLSRDRTLAARLGPNITRMTRLPGGSMSAVNEVCARAKCDVADGTRTGRV